MDTQTEKIAIIIPTIHKDEIFMETINSILDVYQDNWIILIGEQGKKKDWSLEKQIFYHSACAEAHKSLRNQDRIKIHALPYNCGLSFSRNELVKLADNLGIRYVLITADSIKFTESMKKINYLIKYLNYSKDFNIDLLGINLSGRIGWEAFLDLKDSFILDFIDKKKQPDEKFIANFWRCDIVRNFFLATTKSLLNAPWDNNGKMAEHSAFFWEYKKAGYKVGYTDYCNGEYLSNNDKIYKSIRNKNLQEGRKYFMEKYNLKKWITYKHLERIK